MSGRRCRQTFRCKINTMLSLFSISIALMGGFMIENKDSFTDNTNYQGLSFYVHGYKLSPVGTAFLTTSTAKTKGRNAFALREHKQRGHFRTLNKKGIIVKKDSKPLHYPNILCKNMVNTKKIIPTIQSWMTQMTLTTLLWLTSFFLPMNIVLSSTTTTTPLIIPSYASAAEETSKVVGQLKGSGLFFKDTLQIESFDDPKVRGVKLYISTFQIPITEKLSGKNFFQDPSYASITCARINNVPISIANNIGKGLAGEEVFEEKKSLLFKDLRVYRIFDESTNTIVYVSYNTRFDKSDDSNKSRFKSSLCAINLNDPITVSSAEATSTSSPPTES